MDDLSVWLASERYSLPKLGSIVVYMLGGADEVQADCICIVYLCVSVCVVEGGGGASLTLA